MIKKILASAFILLFSAQIFAQEITLNYFMETTVKSDRTFESILIDSYNLNYAKVLALPAEDLILSVLGNYDVSNDSTTGSVALSKLFLPSGTDLEASYSISDVMGPQTSSFSLSFSQPIAKNAFGYTYRMTSEIEDYAATIAEYQITEAYEEYFSYIINLYYTWYSNYAALKTAELSLTESKKLLKNIQAKKNAGIADKVDVNKIEIQSLEKEKQHAAILQKYTESLNLVKNALGSKNEIIPVNPGIYNDKELPQNSNYKSAVYSNRTLAILDLLTRKAEVSEAKAFNNLLPSAYINGNMETSGDGNGLSNPSRDYYIGFSVDIPLLLGGKETAGYDKAKNDNKQQKLKSEQSSLTYKTTIENLFLNITAQKTILQASNKQVELAELVLKEEQKRYSQARISLNDLISAVNSFENYRFEQIDQEIKLNRLIIEWFRLSDSLIEKIN